MSTLFGRRVVYTSIACISASALYYRISAPSAASTLIVQKMLPTYQATFSVPLSCNSCVNDITTALSGLPGKLPRLFLPSPTSLPLKPILSSTANFLLRSSFTHTDQFSTGIQSTSFSLPSQLVTTTGTAPPSSIINTIQSTGRPAILRGSGAPNSMCLHSTNI